MKQLFETSYVGKVNNNGDGRQLFRGECIAYLDQLVRLSAIQPLMRRPMYRLRLAI